MQSINNEPKAAKKKARNQSVTGKPVANRFRKMEDFEMREAIVKELVGAVKKIAGNGYLVAAQEATKK